MPDRIGTRYVPSTQIVSFPHGALHHGDDIFLTRNVLLYSKKVANMQLGIDYISALQDKAAFIHDGFHHMLDTSIADDAVTIILQARPGSLLTHHVHTRKWPYADVVAIISDLGVSLLDAMEERITGFSVQPNNLWLSDQNKLSVINYWEGDESGEQGAIGLCRLMIQLLTGSELVSDTFEVMHTSLERASVPSATMEQKLALIRLIKFICHGQSSLSSLVFGLRSLPPSVPLTGAVKAPAPNLVKETAPPLEIERSRFDNEAQSRSPLSAKLIALSAITTLVVGSIVVWQLWPEPKIVETVVMVTPTPSSTGIATATPSSKAVLTSTNPDSEKTVVPNLIGQTQQDAEQILILAGLHYKFFLEASKLPVGTVVRQDPVPGTNGLKEDNVTFWVSRAE